MVYSASWNYSIREFESASYIVKRQIIWALAGLAIAAAISRLSYRYYQKTAIVIMLGTLMLLVLVLFLNSGSEGYARTLLAGSIQPSEMAKLAIVIYLSVWLTSRREELSSISFGLIPLMFILGLTAGLIVIQPDLSAAATVVILGCLMFYLAGADYRQIILLLVVVILLGLLVATIIPTGKERIGYYFQGLQDPANAHYQVKRGLEAMVRGGIFGVGIGKGVTKFTGLPVPWTDSIFAVIAEELGLFGSLVFIGLFIFILWRGISISKRCEDQQGRLLGGGIIIWITLEALLNISVMMGLLPYAGNALPLVSAGGSNMVTTLAGVGILLNLARNAKSEPDRPEGRFLSAVINLRGRNRRRRVPGAVSSQSSRD
jgi:cell division protein FtsW